MGFPLSIATRHTRENRRMAIFSGVSHGAAAKTFSAIFMVRPGEFLYV
jgi:hypothetical protein